MHINFAPQNKFEFNLKALKAFKLNRLNMVIVAGSILGLMVMFGGCQKMRLMLIESAKSDIEFNNNELKQRAEEKGMNVSQAAGKMPAIRAYEGRIQWSKVLYEVSGAIPNNIWISQLSGTAKDRKLQLTGEAPDHPSVAALVNSLTRSPRLSDVALLSSDVATVGSITKIKFQIECKLKP